MTVSEQIDQFIAENGGNTRDALNVALTRLEQMEMKLAAVRANAQMEIIQARWKVQKEFIDAAINSNVEGIKGEDIYLNESDAVMVIYRPENLPDSQ